MAGVLRAMIDDDAVLMFLEPWRAFDSVPVEDLMARRVSFAAQNAELRRIAGIFKTCCRRRVRFVPRARADHLTFLLDQVALRRWVGGLGLDAGNGRKARRRQP